MDHRITAAVSDHQWDQALALLKRVYVDEGYTSADRARAFMQRRTFEEGGELLVALHTVGTVLGAVLYLHIDSPLRQVAEPGEAEFRMLAVASESRGSGIGEALVNACVERARANGNDALVLWSQPIMHAAHRLYERLGFARAPHRDQQDVRGFTRMVYVLER